MSKEEKARPTVGAAEQARTGNVLTDSYSHDHCISNPVAGQTLISDYLSAGQENAVPLRQWVRTGAIPTRRIGQKSLLFYPNLVRYLQCEDGADNTPATVAAPGIRRVDL